MSAYKVECKKKLHSLFPKTLKSSSQILYYGRIGDRKRDWSRPPVRICEHIFFRIRLYVHMYIIETPGSNPC